MSNTSLVEIYGTLNESTLTNSGTLEEGNGGLVGVIGNLDNTGSGIINTTQGGYDPGNTLTVGGTLENDASATINDNGSGDQVSANTLQNEGGITVSSGALLYVGTAVPNGTGYVQDSGGTLDEDIGALTTFDVINVTGGASLAGTLEVNLLDGYTPSIGNTFEFLTYSGSKTASFTLSDPIINGSEEWSLEYLSGQVDLTVVSYTSTTPEPASFLLTGAGLLAVGLWGRRQRARKNQR